MAGMLTYKLTCRPIGREELNPGDHICVQRYLGLYSHHGIYVGKGMVIHVTGPRNPNRFGFASFRSSSASFRSSFSATGPSTTECQICGNKAFRGGMVQTCLDCFQDGCSLLLYDYESSIVRQFLQRYSRRVRSPSKVVKSAYYIKERQREKPDDYNPFVKNCEHFATFCKTGLAFSVQSSLLGPIFNLGTEIGSYTDGAESDTD